MLPAALEPLAQYAQFIIFRKADKTPCDYRTGSVCDAQNPINQTDVATAYAAAKSRHGYGVGFVLRATDPFVVFDADKALQDDNTWSAESLQLVAALPGAAVEVSISGRGLHIWATSANVPAHACKNLSAHFEMYHEGRYIALGEYPGTTGNVATDCTTALPAIISKWFPPSAPAASQGLTDETDPEWRGPADDTELLHRMLASKPSLGAAFGGRATIAELWNRDIDALARAFPASGDAPYDASSADAALATHLAWWTGKNAERIERMMRQSGLARDKFDRADYLPRTIAAAIQMTGSVYQERPATVADERTGGVVDLEQSLVPFDSVENPFDVLPHIVTSWMPQDEVTLLAGHGGSGKSYVAMLIAVHVALGWPFAGLTTTQTKVLFFSAEDGKRVLLQRRARICRALGIDLASLEGKLFLLDASDFDPALYREQRMTVNDRQRVVTETPLLDELAALLKNIDAGLVIIDNASDTFDGDEIRRTAVRAFVRSLRQHLARPGRAVLLLAHINKAAANGSRFAGSEDYSGSTAWHNSVRSRLSLVPDGDGMKVEHAKANLGGKAAPVRLEWVNGVPLAARGHTDTGAAERQAAESVRDSIDKAALVALIQDFDRRGERVTTAVQGSATVLKLLKGQPGFPKNTDSERLMRLLRELETDGGIFRRTVRTPDRKQREVFTCAPIPNGQSVQVGSAPEGMCADEPV